MKYLRVSHKILKPAISPYDPQPPNDENIDPNQQCQKKPLQKVPNQSMDLEEKTRPQRQEEKYEKEIFQFLISSVRKAPACGNYFRAPDWKLDITENMRMVLINWLIEVHLKYKLQEQTLFITVAIIDEFLGQGSVSRKELQLLGTCALWIASKYQQTYQVPKLNNLVMLCDYTYSEKQILEMESRILLRVGFEFILQHRTALTYFQSLIRFTSALNPKDHCLGLYLLEATLFEVEMQRHNQLTVAASVIYFIQKIRGYKLRDQQRLPKLCGLDEELLRSCARELFFLWKKLDQIQEVSSLVSKFHQKSYFEVAKIKMNQKPKK